MTSKMIVSPTLLTKGLLLTLALLWLTWSFEALAATLSVSPQTGVYTVGGVFSVQVRVNTEGQSINAAEGTLSFDPSKVSVVSVSKGPIFNLWTADPAFSNSAGTITFGGGSPAGYQGGAGSVMNITFRALTAGDTKVTFKDGSVLAADGRGTNILRTMGSGAYTLVANDVPAEPEVIEYVAPANTPGTPQITSTTHPDPNGWYQNTTAKLTWTIPSGVSSVRTLLDESSGSIPTKVYETPINNIEIPDLSDGVSYFHLQFKNADGWGRVAHYRLAVDTTDPAKFEIILASDNDPSSPTQKLKLDVSDELSGVARYTVQIDSGEPYEYIAETGSSTLTLPPLEPGQHSVIMEAFDAAGNSLIDTFSFTILAFDRPEFTDYPSQINSEVIPVIKGQTRPNSTVTISLVMIGTEPITETVISDGNGVFTFIPSGQLQNGVYELTAVAIDGQGAKSEPSEAIRIAVQDPGYIQIGSFIVSILSVIIPLISLLGLFLLMILYGWRRLRIIRGTVTVETAEALAVLDREFSSLKKELSKQQANLEQSRRTKKLTQAETELITTMETAMKKSRERVEKEISDVDDIVE